MQSRLFSYPDTHRHRLGVNYSQIPVNQPIVPVANFQRDGFMAINNQGARPNYQSTIVPLTYLRHKGSANGAARDAEREANHEKWIGGSYWDLSEITERQFIHVFIQRNYVIELDFTVDFEQPRALYTTVMNDVDRAHLVDNVVGHVSGVKSPQLKQKIREFRFSGETSVYLTIFNSLLLGLR